MKKEDDPEKAELTTKQNKSKSPLVQDISLCVLMLLLLHRGPHVHP